MDPSTDPGSLRPTLRYRLSRVAAVVALACAGPALGCATAGKKSADRKGAAEKHYEIAVGSFHSGLFDDAKMQLQRALAADPTHANSHYLTGVLFLQEGKTMLDSIESQLCLADEAADNQRQRAEGLHQQAHDAFEKAAEHYGDEDAGRGRAFNSMSVVSLHFHDHVAAIEEARAALEDRYYNERYSALSNLGWAYYGKGDLVDAMTELRQAVLINPDYCVGHYRLAQVYLDYGLTEQALEEASMVLENDRCPIQDAHRIVGVANLRLGMGDDAAQAFQSCVSLAPRSCLAEDCERFLSGGGAGTVAP